MFENTIDGLPDPIASAPPSVHSPRASSLAWGKGKQARSYHSRSPGAAPKEIMPLISAKVRETLDNHSTQQQMFIHLQNAVRRCNRLRSATQHSNFNITPKTFGDFDIVINVSGDAEILDGIYNCTEDLRSTAKLHLHREKEEDGEVWVRAPLAGPRPDRGRCTALRGAITSLNLMSKRLLLVTKYSA